MDEPTEPIVEDGIEEAQRVKSKDIPMSGDGLDVPSIFVDSIRGMSIARQVAKINLVEFRPDMLNKEMSGVLVARLILPTSQVRSWAKFFARMADRIEQGSGKQEAGKSGDEDAPKT